MLSRLVYEGGIEIICGPMFSGKTEELLRRLNRFHYAKIPFIIFKHTSDNREFDFELFLEQKEKFENCDRLVSRNGKGIFENVFKAENGKELLRKVEEESQKRLIKVIAIDEAQFFDIDLVEVVDQLALKGFHVILAGLDKNYMGEPFEVMAKLSCVCDEIKKLTAICTICHNLAGFTQLVANIQDLDSSQPLIGNQEYEARCRKHFYPPKLNKQN